MNAKRSNGRSRLAATALRCQPDSRLVGLVREGHELAFEEIVRRYRPPLVSFAAAIVPRAHAEDVVQEALAKAHRALSSGDAEISLRPWLYAIVRNRALNALRDEPAHDHLDESFDGVPQPQDVAARREELAALTARLKGLPAPQREAIVKRELEGRSHDEIASALGLSVGAVRGLIYRARATLRDGAGMLFPMPVLRALLSPESTPDAVGVAGAAAGLAAGGGGGIALKAGATLGVAVIAAGSGLAIQRNGANTDNQATLADRGAAASRDGEHPVSSWLGAGLESENGSDDSAGSSGSSGPSDSDGDGSSGPSGDRNSGPGSVSGSSGEGSGSAERGDGGSTGAGDDGGGSGSLVSAHGEGSSGSDGGGGESTSSGTSGSGDAASGSGGSGSSGDGTAMLDSSGDGGGSSGSGGGGGDLTAAAATTTTDGGHGGTSGSG